MTCLCSHRHATHLHYRKGTDCSACGPQACPHYRQLPAPRRHRLWATTHAVLGRWPEVCIVAGGLLTVVVVWWWAAWIAAGWTPWA